MCLKDKDSGTNHIIIVSIEYVAVFQIMYYMDKKPGLLHIYVN